MATTIKEAIAETGLAGVQSASADGTSVTALDIDKQITADKYAAAQTAKARNHMGLTFRQLEPGGCG